MKHAVSSRCAYLLHRSLLGLHVGERLLHDVKLLAQIRDGPVFRVWTHVLCSGGRAAKAEERGEMEERRERQRFWRNTTAKGKGVKGAIYIPSLFSPLSASSLVVGESGEASAGQMMRSCCCN